VTQAQELEQAILARAGRLAEEFRERGTRSRDSILREASEKLRLREQQEDVLARAAGERVYRQRVQAQELKMQSDLDRTRWNLVRSVEARLTEQVRAHQGDDAAYLETLCGFIAAAINQIEKPVLLIQANTQDLKRLEAQWSKIEQLVPEGKTVRLDKDNPLTTIGGVLVISEDQSIRINQTFEGRLTRLERTLQRTILERLLPGGLDTGNIFGG
jgi:V/A-type H+-transporting ATPase subunit E